MPDRCTKAVLTLIAASLIVLAADSLSGLPTAQAQAPGRKRCVWTQVVETGKPSLGENGKVKLGREWQAVSDAGWELKGTSFGSPLTIPAPLGTKVPASPVPRGHDAPR